MPGFGDRRGVGGTLCWFALSGLMFAGLGPAPAFAVDATICRYFSQLPDDCGRAVVRRFGNLRDYRYQEIDLFARDVLKKDLYESKYNTTGLNGGDESRDSAPQSLVQTLNAKAIAKKYQALFVQVGVPRYWTIDWLSDRVGNVRDFGGLNAAWMGYWPAPKAADSSKAPAKAYRYSTVPRSSAEGFKKGSKIYLLDDPNDRTWVMRSYANREIKDLTIDALDTLGDRIALPPGWKFRTVVLAKDLILEPKSGAAAATEDDNGDIYDLTGPGQSNFRP